MASARSVRGTRGDGHLHARRDAIDRTGAGAQAAEGEEQSTEGHRRVAHARVFAILAPGFAPGGAGAARIRAGSGQRSRHERFDVAAQRREGGGGREVEPASRETDVQRGGYRRGEAAFLAGQSRQRAPEEARHVRERAAGREIVRTGLEKL